MDTASQSPDPISAAFDAGLAAAREPIDALTQLKHEAKYLIGAIENHQKQIASYQIRLNLVDAKIKSRTEQVQEFIGDALDSPYLTSSIMHCGASIR